MLYLIGVLFYGGLANPWHEIRWVGVLQRIAVCYFCGAIVFLNFRQRGQAILLAVLLLGYWALMEFVAVPGFMLGDYSPEGNVAGHVDRLLLPGRAWFRDWGFDPEGLLSTIPAVGNCLMGILSGELLRAARRAATKSDLAAGRGRRRPGDRLCVGNVDADQQEDLDVVVCTRGRRV